MSEYDFDGMLDLTGADESVGSFDAIPSGKYNARIREAEWRFTKGGAEAKLPEGTPYLNVQVQITDEERNGMKVANRVVFATLMVPPSDYDATKASKMKGAMLNFLRAAGYTDADINKKGFRVDPDDLQGREVVVQVQKYRNDYTNDDDNRVSGFKPAGSIAGAEATAGQVV